MNGFFESATMHVNGLVEIMANRGPLVDGLLPLENVFLQKIVAWFVLPIRIHDSCTNISI